MGWGKWFLLGDLGQQLDLHEQENELRELRSQLRKKNQKTGTLADQLQVLQRENEELKLYLLSLMRILIAKGVVSKQEIAEMVDLVDAVDGTKDGRYTGEMDLERE